MRPKNTSGQPNLPRNEKREAIPALTGYDYQVWIAINQWFDLSDRAVLFLEGAEDIDNVDGDVAETFQIRHTQAKISLNSNYARESLIQFWNLIEREQHGRDVKYLYFTTSEIAIENNANFGGLSGIKFWEVAKHDETHALYLAKYLAEGFSEPSSLVDFLRSADAEQLQGKLFSRFSWLTSQPNIDVVSEVVLDKIRNALKKLYEHDYPKSSLEQIRGQLHSYCWEQLRKQDLSERILTKESLTSELQRAATITVTLPMHASASVIGMATHLNLQGSALTIGMLVEPTPILPKPTLRRKGLVDFVKSKLRTYTPVLLTGTVHQGKTTIASIVANSLDNNACWVDLAERPAGQIREIFSFFSLYIEAPGFPSLIVFDDINTSLGQQAIYSRAIQKLMFRANTLGVSILLTARGSCEAVDSQFTALNCETVEVQSMSLKDIEDEAVALGCEEKLAAQWAVIVSMQTSGHAKLVQVRLNELCAKGWLPPASDDFLSTSQALQNERHLGRILLSESLSANGNELEFVYTAAEFTFAPSRDALLNLGDLIPNIASPGDLITRLEGKWLEAASGGRLRVTPLIKAERGKNWSEEKFRLAHSRLYDAISKQDRVTPLEGAGLVYHGYICKDGERLANAIVNTLAITDSTLKALVFRNLSWLSVAALQENQRIFPEQKTASLFLRNLQFQVAVHEENTDVAKILKLWWSELESSSGELYGRMSQLLHITVMTAQVCIPMKLVAKSAKLLRNDENSIGMEIMSGLASFKEDGLGEIPDNSSPFQIFLALRQHIAASLEAFMDLLLWIQEEDEVFVLQFDRIIPWPLSQHCGAFVHSTWINYSKQRSDWQELLKVFRRAWEISIRKGMKNFGIEIAKAISLIECEYKKDLSAGLKILNIATEDFGASAILEEQRANCYYHNKQYENAIIVWHHIALQFPGVIKDPFAYRRAGIAAAEVKNWDKAAEYFQAGARCIPDGVTLPTRSSLLAEAALAYSKAGSLEMAVELMRRCEEELPQTAKVDGDARWEATLRALTAAATQIRGDSPSTPTGESFVLKSGFSSNPELVMPETDKLQKFRLDIFKLETHTSYLYAHPENKKALAVVEGLLSASPEVAFLAANNMLVLQIKNGVQASYIYYVERFVEASEKLRAKSPFAFQKFSDQSLVIGHYILPILLEKITVDDFIRFCEEASCDFDITASRITLMELRDQFQQSPKVAGQTLADGNASLVARAGAALVILKSLSGRADAITAAQAMLAAVAMRALVAMKSTDIEIQVAANFIEYWKPVLRSPFQLKNPEWTIPALNEVFRDVRRKKTGLKQFLRCASAASGVNIDGIIAGFPDRN